MSTKSIQDGDAAREGSTIVAPPLLISVIVPVRNEARHIEQTLRQLVSQDYDPDALEIIVVDGQSTDHTPALVAKFARRHANVRCLSNPKRWSSAARNIGIRQARGDVVLIVDGHCRIDDNRLLRRLAAAFSRSGAACVGRPQPQDLPGAGPLGRAIAAARASRLGHHPSSYIYASQPQFVPAESVAVAYRRSLFETVGYFDEAFDACEDLELNHRVDRAGLPCYFTPEVAVRYHPRDSLRSLLRQLGRYGRGRVRMARKHPETVSVKTFLPGAFVFGCLAGLPLAWWSAYLAAIYVSVLAVYAAIVTAASAAITIRRRDAAMLPWLPWAFFAIHFGAGTGILYEAIFGRRAARTVPRAAKPAAGSSRPSHQPIGNRP